MKESTRFLRVVYTLATPVIRLLYPFDVHGAENVPTDHPVVLCGNHAHAVDPIMMRVALPKGVGVRIMAKKELLDTPLLGAFLEKLGAFGVDRGHSDLIAVKTAIKTIRDGEHLMVFPEGTRVKREGEVRPKGGVVMIAMRTGAPLLPVYVGKPDKLFRKTHIVFGEPYAPKTATRHGTAEEYQEYADEVVRRAYDLGREFEKQ